MTTASASWILFNTALRSVKATCCDRICYPLWDAPRPNKFKEALAPISFLPTSQRWVKYEEFPERSSDLMLKASDSSSNRNSEKERSFAHKKTEHAPAVQLSITTEYRLLRHVVQGRARCPAWSCPPQSRHDTATCRHPTYAFAHLPRSTS